MRKLFVLAFLGVLFVPTASCAQAWVGLRFGFARAMGDYVRDAPIDREIWSQIPIQLDAMYNVTPDIGVGLYLSYGLGGLNRDFMDRCNAVGVTCSASNTRIGIQAAYALNDVLAHFAPWAGVGVGYEWYTLKGEADGISASATTSGFEFLNLQVGCDYPVNRRVLVGPYLQLSVGQYTSVESESIAHKGTHEWLGFGVRGRFDL